MEKQENNLWSGLWAIILAAGESRRMKAPKMLLPFNGKTIIEKVIENVAGSGVDKISVVLGAGKEDILKVIRKYSVTYCYNDNYKQGMLSSVKCGFKSLPEGFDAALVFLGDQPMIPAVVTDAVINGYRRSGKGLVVPVCDRKRGHPLLISSEYRDEIEKLKTDEGLHLLLKKFPEDVLEVETNTPSILKDIDTQEDYLEEANQN
jgi:molybdenum cofactor cytidylyltransferase